MTDPIGRAPLGTVRNKELRKIIRIAQKAGWTVWRTHRGHFRFRPPAGSTCPSHEGEYTHEDHRAGGRTLTHGSSDSDKRALEIFRGDLRRAGLRGV